LTTNGHTDEFVKWCGPNHVILAYVPGKQDPRTLEGRTQFRLETINKILTNKGIQIYRIPVAPPKVYNVSEGSGTYDGFFDMSYSSDGPYWTNKTLVGELITSAFENGANAVPIISARSYLNLVVTNKNIIVPAYGDKVRDKESLMLLQKIFELPGNPTGRTRKVIQVLSADAINTGGGGMHCITQNQPVGL
jgi:agmatine deiminase